MAKMKSEDLLRLNAVGISQGTIARMHDCSMAAVSMRLKALNVPPVDTRKSFMEDVFTGLPEHLQEGLADHLQQNPLYTINDYVRELIARDISQRINTPKDPT